MKCRKWELRSEPCPSHLGVAWLVGWSFSHSVTQSLSHSVTQFAHVFCFFCIKHKKHPCHAGQVHRFQTFVILLRPFQSHCQCHVNGRRRNVNVRRITNIGTHTVDVQVWCSTSLRYSSMGQPQNHSAAWKKSFPLLLAPSTRRRYFSPNL